MGPLSLTGGEVVNRPLPVAKAIAELKKLMVERRV